MEKYCLKEHGSLRQRRLVSNVRRENENLNHHGVNLAEFVCWLRLVNAIQHIIQYSASVSKELNALITN